MDFSSLKFAPTEETGPIGMFSKFLVACGDESYDMSHLLSGFSKHLAKPLTQTCCPHACAAGFAAVGPSLCGTAPAPQALRSGQ